jgi:hypothetical protein
MSVTVSGLLFIGFEIVLPAMRRRYLFPKLETIIAGVNFSEIQVAHLMVFFM